MPPYILFPLDGDAIRLQMNAYKIHTMTLYNLQCFFFFLRHITCRRGTNRTPHTWKKEKEKLYGERAIFFINIWRQDIERCVDGDEMYLCCMVIDVNAPKVN